MRTPSKPIKRGVATLERPGRPNPPPAPQQQQQQGASPPAPAARPGWKGLPRRLFAVLRSLVLPPVAGPRWRELGQGLALVVMGEVLILVLGGIGLTLLAPAGAAAASLAGLPRHSAPLVGWGLTSFAAILGYVLVLAGQRRCMVYAPPGHGARALPAASLLAALASPVCFLAAHFSGGEVTYEALRHGPGALADLDPLADGVAFQIAGLLLGLLSVLLFSGFTQAIADCLADDTGSRRRDYFFWFVAFVLGGSIGVVAEARRTSTAQEVWPVFGLGWLICLLWHTLLVRDTRRLVAEAEWEQENNKRGPASSSGPAAAARQPGQVTLQAASYFRPGAYGVGP